MSTDERLDYLERQLTDIADYVVRQHEPPRRQKRKANPLVTAFLVLFLIALAGLVALNYAAAFGLFVPPGWQQAEQPQPLPTAIVRIPTAPPRPVVVPASVPEPQPAAIEAAPAPVPAPQPVEAIHPDAVPGQIGVNADLAAGGSGSTAPLPAVLPTVVPAQPVLPYDPADATAVATWNQALRNSGVDVDATQVACNADLAAGGMGCQP